MRPTWVTYWHEIHCNRSATPIRQRTYPTQQRPQLRWQRQEERSTRAGKPTSSKLVGHFVVLSIYVSNEWRSLVSSAECTSSPKRLEQMEIRIGASVMLVTENLPLTLQPFNHNMTVENRFKGNRLIPPIPAMRHTSRNLFPQEPFFFDSLVFLTKQDPQSKLPLGTKMQEEEA